MFEKEIRPVSDVAMNILKKRYFQPNENTWKELVDRVSKAIYPEGNEDFYNLLLNRYFVLNSPALVNLGTNNNGGAMACFVLPFEDTIEDIYQTKKNFALIARKGGGCGTTLSDIRPEGSKVHGSSHGYAGGPIKFADTISHDMRALTQSGFREMAIMFTMSVYHPDIMKFISVKYNEEDKRIENANISVVVDNEFMKKVANNETYWTEFNGKKYEELQARQVFEAIVEGIWRNGEPGLLFSEAMNDSPYKYTGQFIKATNPCAEQPLPPYGCCNLGSLDITKFVVNGKLDYGLLQKAIEIAVRTLDRVIDINNYPGGHFYEFEKWAKENRPIGLGIMGWADYLLMLKVAYGSKESIEELEKVLAFIYSVAVTESVRLGKELGIPTQCKKLPTPRRNITVMTIAPTGTISLIAGCSSGIEPIFSEITIRNDKTGSYQFEHDLANQSYFRCAVAANGAKEVTWEEHVNTLAAAQRHIDSGVSKTCNVPQNTRRETIERILFSAWENQCKGITIYRNNSRQVEVLSPKELKKNKCPQCGKDLITEGHCQRCSDPECGYSLCNI